MAKPEWGRKRICYSCGSVFYDLRRDPIVCPKCDAKFDPEAILKSRRSRVTVVEEPKPKPSAPDTTEADKAKDEKPAAEGKESAAEGEESAAEDEDTDLNAEDALPEDASDLSKDEDDVAEVREHLQEDDDDKTG